MLMPTSEGDRVPEFTWEEIQALADEERRRGEAEGSPDDLGVPGIWEVTHVEMSEDLPVDQVLPAMITEESANVSYTVKNASLVSPGCVTTTHSNEVEGAEAIPRAKRTTEVERLEGFWKMPNVQLKIRGKDLSLHEALQNRRGLIFGVPGAFTPMCTNKHLPGIRDCLPWLKKAVDQIACVAVNDPYVLKAWARELKLPSDLLLISDWEGTFTKALGLEIDATPFHLGLRCRRFAIIIEAGTILWFGLEREAFVDKVAQVLHQLQFISSDTLESILRKVEETAARATDEDVLTDAGDPHLDLSREENNGGAGGGDLSSPASSSATEGDDDDDDDDDIDVEGFE